MYLQNNEQVDTRKHSSDKKLDVDGLLAEAQPVGKVDHQAGMMDQELVVFV
jgi:hypothetical protein